MPTNRFVGEDERLTPAEKRLISAFRDQSDVIPANLGPIPGALAPQSTVVDTARVRAALRQAMERLRRLQTIAEADVAEKEDARVEGEKKPEVKDPRASAGTDEAVRVLQRLLAEETLGVRRGAEED